MVSWLHGSSTFARPTFCCAHALTSATRVHMLLPALSCLFSTILPRHASRPHESAVCTQTQPSAAAAHCMPAMQPMPPAAVHATHELPNMEACRVEELQEHDHVGSAAARHDIDSRHCAWGGIAFGATPRTPTQQIVGYMSVPE